MRRPLLPGRLRRTPFVFQMATAECGLACLTMVARSHGRPATLHGLRGVLDVGRDGVTALALVRAAGSVGLRGRAVRCAPAALTQVPLPAVALWENDHFVVVDQVRRDRVRVLDPSAGRRRLSPEEFAAGYEGVALLFEPDPRAGVVRVAEPSIWPVLRPSVRRAASVFALLGLLTLVAHLLTLVTPFLVGRTVDRAASSGPLGSDMLLAALLTVVAGYVVTRVRTAVATLLQRRLDGDLAPGFFGHMIRLPHAELERRGTGDLMGRMESLTLARLAVTGQAVTTVLDVALTAVALVALLLRSVPSGLIVAVAVVVQLLAVLRLTGPIHESTQQAALCEGSVHGFTAEALQGVSTLKSLGAEGSAQDRFAELAARRRAAEARRDGLAGRLEAVMTSVQILTPLAVLAVGYADAVARGSIGGLMVAVGLAGAAVSPAASMVNGIRGIQAARSHLLRLADVWGLTPEALPTPVELAGAIELDGVGVRYPGQERWALRDVRLRIEPGEHLAVVGPSGSGKTTLALVLAALQDPTEGRVRYDGRDAADLGTPGIRRAMGVVLQDVWLFAGTIEDNIRVDRPLTDLQVREAARNAAIHDTIRALPLGYRTRLGDGGSGLSGGQLQRLALARALAHQPAVVVMDEATSHLDPAAEAQVSAALADLGVTRVTVAHRLGTVRRADRIVVLEAGRVVQCGTYEELAVVPGPFQDLLRVDGGQAAASPRSSPAVASLPGTPGLRRAAATVTDPAHAAGS